MSFKIPEWTKLILTSTDDSIDDGIYIDEQRYRKYLKEIGFKNGKYLKYYNALLIEKNTAITQNKLLKTKIKELQKELKGITLLSLLKKKGIWNKR